jgi:putative nucleotidyltransferase with HDIG domain
VPVGQPLPFDLYVNSSSIADREHFVRIFPSGGVLTAPEVTQFEAKYKTIYVPENQRAQYMSLFAPKGNADPVLVEKTVALKATAISHLDTLFVSGAGYTTEVLQKAVEGSRDVVENFVEVLQNTDVDKLQDLIASLSFHDFYTYDHSINVAMYSILIFRDLRPNATREQIIQAGLGGLLHDIGKVKIPTRIINNSGKLSDADMKAIQKHPELGREMISQPGVKLPESVDHDLLCKVVHQHHENFDGTGYPGKIAGSSIHELARITAVADMFDAITTKRSYHDPLPADLALGLMQKSAGMKLDPKIFKLFAKNSKEYQPSKTANVELPRGFDPCQPQGKLPLAAVAAIKAAVKR